MSAEQSPSPWYKQLWCWFVLSPLILVVLVSSVTVTIAVKDSDDVVIDNYYKQGRLINQSLEQDERARALNVAGELAFDRVAGEVWLDLSADETLPEKLSLLLSHPVSEDLDQHLVMVQTAPGRYRADLAYRLDYRWYLVLIPELDAAKQNDADWRLLGEIDFKQGDSVALAPRG